ncbi:hypothetical protein [Lapillicoccus sp.]|nr:hypothetical protein [Lapillicoccus sp.]
MAGTGLRAAGPSPCALDDLHVVVARTRSLPEQRYLLVRAGGRSVE